MADRIDSAAFHLKSDVNRLAEHTKRSGDLLMKEITAPVLDKACGAKKSIYLRTLACNGRSVRQDAIASIRNAAQRAIMRNREFEQRRVNPIDRVKMALNNKEA